MAGGGRPLGTLLCTQRAARADLALLSARSLCVWGAARPA